MFWEAGTYLALGAHRGLAGKMSLLLILSPPGTCSSKCPKTLPLFLGCAAEGVRPFPLQVPKRLPGPILPHRSGLRGKDLQIKANFLVIPGFSKAGSAPIPASCPGQHWGIQSTFPPPSLSPTLITPIPDVSQQDISLMSFFLISTKHPQAKLSHQFSSLWHHPGSAKHEVLQALPCPGLCSSTGTRREKSFWAAGTKLSSPHSKIIQQNSPTSPAASKLCSRAIFPIPHY